MNNIANSQWLQIALYCGVKTTIDVWISHLNKSFWIQYAHKIKSCEYNGSFNEFSSHSVPFMMNLNKLKLIVGPLFLPSFSKLTSLHLYNCSLDYLNLEHCLSIIFLYLNACWNYYLLALNIPFVQRLEMYNIDNFCFYQINQNLQTLVICHTNVEEYEVYGSENIQRKLNEIYFFE